MSTSIPPRSRDIGPKKEFGIVASQFNVEYVQGMVDKATSELYELAPRCKIHFRQVPGAFEIPLMAAELARFQRRAGSRLQAVLCLGVIMRGETAHADLIARAVTEGLQRVALETRVPMIHEVLLLDNEEQAKARCLDEQLNRGRHAARAAVEMAQALEPHRTER